jgi:iron complex transport system substrate-binding protein
VDAVIRLACGLIAFALLQSAQAQPVTRIVSLSPHATELIAAAGGQARLVGVSQACDFPPAVTSLPKVASASGVNVERLLSLKPDLVVAWPAGNRPQDIERLRSLGVRVVESSPKSLKDIEDDVRRLGDLLNSQPTASAVADGLRAKREQLAARRHSATTRVFYQLGAGHLFTLNDQHPVMEAMALCGGRNVFGQLTPMAPQVSVEAVALASPDVIAVASERDFREVSAWWAQRTSLFASPPKIILVEGERLHRPTPRMYDAALKMCEMLAVR